MLRELIMRRARLWDAYQEVLARATNDGFSAEDRAELDRMDGELDGLTRDIERLEAGERLSEQFRRTDPIPPAGDQGPPEGRGTPPVPSDGPPDDQRYAEAFVAFMRNGRDGVTAEQHGLLTARFQSGSELRALGVGTDAGGGYAVPPGFINRLVEQLRNDYPMIREANVLTTDSGQSVEWPTSDDTANKGAILAENTQVTELDVVLGTKTLAVYMYVSRLVRISLQLLQDSGFDFESWLRQVLADRLGAILNEHWTTGTGSSQPQGIVTGATVGVTAATGGTVAVTYDNLVDLEHSVREVHRVNAAFMLSDAALKTVRKLKDGDGRPIWQPSLQAGVPNNLNGRRYVVNEDMPAPAASAKSVAFGDFGRAYQGRIVNGAGVIRFGERYMDFLQVGFLAYQRSGGIVADANAVKTFQHSAT